MFLMEPAWKSLPRTLRTIALGYDPDESPAKLIKTLRKNTASRENWCLYDFDVGQLPPADSDQ
jgi:hypothetical protein